MADGTLFAQVKDPSNRANPYPLYARLRDNPVALQEDGTFVVSTHAEIRALLFDPRLSSEDLPPTHHPATGNPFKDWLINPYRDRVANHHRPFIFRDPPDHDALRRMVMGQFTPERVRAMQARIGNTIDQLLDTLRGRSEIDLVDDFSYPLPVTVICELLGVPREDETKFHGWATQLASALEPDSRQEEENHAKTIDAFDDISAYMKELIEQKRRHPQDDLLTGLATHADPRAGRMDDYDLISTAILLLVAGHETTVNLITNGMLTLLRHPDQLETLRQDPERAPRLIEELLRFEPPVHFRTRKTLGEIAIAGTTIPKHAPLVLLFAAGSRDPSRFPDGDRFDPDRADNQHFGFGGALHYCVGAPLARIETELALVALAQRLPSPHLLEDPPPYRPGASLRGPEHLRLGLKGVDEHGGPGQGRRDV